MKSYIFFLFLTIFTLVGAGSASALSQSFVEKGSYEGKLDIKNVNGLGKNISTDFFAGSMNFQYPFVFPEGVRQMTPSLSLTYSSNDSNAFSPYGYGFSLSIPRIQRSMKKGTSELYEGDEYSAFGNELILVAPGSFRSKDASDMNLYMLTGSKWLVKTPKGNTLTFGQTPYSRIADTELTSNIYAWFLDEEMDQFGNKITYTYQLDGGQPYLQSIQYGYNGTNALYTIEFSYKIKTASLISYRTQFPIETKRLLGMITIRTNNDGRTRGYEFTYDALDIPTSHLMMIQEFSQGTKKPPILISYGEGQYSHFITRIENSIGGIMSFEYAPSTSYRDPAGDISNRKLPFIAQTLTKKTFEDLVTGVRSTEMYTYDYGHFYYDETDLWGREYAGFGKVDVLDDTTRNIYFFHQSQASEIINSKVADNIAKKGRLYRTETYDYFTGDLKKVEYTRYDMRTIIGDRKLVFPSYKITSLYSGVDHADTATTYVFDDFGNITQEVNLGWVNAELIDGTYTDIPGDSSEVRRDYLSNSSSNLYGFLSREITYGWSGGLLLDKSYKYDGLTGNVTQGLLTQKISNSTTGSGSISESYVYNAKGLLIESYDAGNFKTSITYDAWSIAPRTIKNPFLWETENQYDYFYGKVMSTRSPNNVTYKMLYDPWGRVTETIVNEGSVDQKLTKMTYFDTVLPNKIEQIVYFDTGMTSKKTTTQYLDGWGRNIMNITSTEKQNQLVRSDIHYDAVGNQIYGSYPYFVTSVDISGLYDSLSGQKDGEAFRAAQAGASYTYDALGRIISEKDALGTTLHEYFPKKEKITNALGDVMEVENDAYGKIVLVREFLGTSPKETKYSYNALGNITGMVDAQGNIRAWYYDGFGRLAKAEDMHDPTDVTFASKQYQYNNLGKITRYTTPSGEYITYNYDDLGRVTGETGSGISRTYTYDVGSRSLGTLWMVQNSGSLVTYNYDPLGRKTGEMRDFVSKSYNIAYKYNIQNALVELTYPDNGKTTYNYLSGYLDSINYRSYSGTLYNIIKDITYSPNGTMKTQKYGNGITRDTIRDPNYNHRISRVTIASGATTYLDTQYSYDAINNIVGASVDGLDPIRKTITYTYDDLARLTNSFYNYAVGGYNRIQNQSYSYTYDDIGNILNMSSVGNYSYSEDGYTNPHAVTSAGDLSYGYDIAGNMTSRTNSGDTINFRYSLYGELLGADHAGESTNYLYDHTNRRIVKYNSGILEHHVIDGYEVEYETGSLTTMSGSVPFTLTTRLTHIMFGDEKIATLQSQSENIDNIKTDQLVYHHSDHLNSSTFDFSQTGSLLQATDYQPFGKTITYAVTSARVPGKKGGYQNKYLFANKQLDNETDLQYFEKRYYDPRIGRFTTEDPVFWEVSLTKRPNQYFTDPEQWNSYSYVRNNPINFTDPTGEAMGGDVSLPGADIATGLISIGTTIVRGYYLMVNFFIVEGPYIVSTTAATTAATQPLIDAASTQGEAGPTAPTGPSGKPPDKQPKDDKGGDQGNNGKKDSKSDKPKSQYKEPKPGLSGKEGAKDAPSYAKGQRPYINESGKDFSKRIMDNQFGKGNYKTGPGTDFNKIQKYGDRNFQNPPKSN